MPAFDGMAAAESPSVEADIAAAPAAITITNAAAKPILKQRPRKKKLIKVRWHPLGHEATQDCACRPGCRVQERYVRQQSVGVSCGRSLAERATSAVRPRSRQQHSKPPRLPIITVIPPEQP